MTRRVVVVGGGPAGLSAAVAAARHGARVTLLEGTDRLGGQYWRHRSERPQPDERSWHHGFATFTALDDAVRTDERIAVRSGAQVWALETTDGKPVLHVLTGDPDDRRSGSTLRPDALVLATGAHDRTLPFPGWTLPGVVTGGAAQALVKGEGVAIGDRVVVAGAGPFLLPVAATLARAGSRVLGVHEASRPAALARGWLPRPWQLIAAAGKAGELAGYAAGQLRGRIPYRTGSGVVAAHGDDRVTAVTLARLDENWSPVPGSERTVECDAVCVSHGFTPRLELAIAAGAALTADRFVAVDALGRTSVPGVLAAGEITGIGGAEAALVEGRLAGAVAAGAADDDPELRADRRRRRGTDGFAARIAAAHGIRPGWTGWLTDSTVVCRCEETTAGTLRRTVALTDSGGLRSGKLTTRAGLGICQARICGRTVETLLAGTDPTTGSAAGPGTDRRPVATPVRFAELAAVPENRPDTPPEPAP